MLQNVNQIFTKNEKGNLLVDIGLSDGRYAIV